MNKDLKRLLKTAQPRMACRHKEYYCWLPDNNWVGSPETGVLPQQLVSQLESDSEFTKRLEREVGGGSKWFETEESATTALRNAVNTQQ